MSAVALQPVKPAQAILDNPLSYIIDVSWDAEASVWIAISDEIPIALESESLEVLISRAKLAATELLGLNYGIATPAEFLFREVALTDG